MSETYEPKRETRCINERRLSLTPLQSNRFGCYSLESIVPFLEFTVTLQSNNLIP